MSERVKKQKARLWTLHVSDREVYELLDLIRGEKPVVLGSLKSRLLELREQIRLEAMAIVERMESEGLAAARSRAAAKREEARAIKEEQERVAVKRKADLDAAMTDHDVVRTWPSSSNPDVIYELRRGRDQEIYCTCPAWKFSKARPRVCKHIKAWVASLADNGQHLKAGGL